MSQTITIDPVTRVEGHGKITIQLNDAGEVADAHFHVTQLRGFETFSEGRPFREMPGLMARICGICPVSHLVASAKACDELLAVRIPRTAVNLRKILNLAQMVQSHALSVFYLSAPDLLMGMDADMNKRNILGMLEVDPQLARNGVRLRQFGQQVIERDRDQQAAIADVPQSRGLRQTVGVTDRFARRVRWRMFGHGNPRSGIRCDRLVRAFL